MIKGGLRENGILKRDSEETPLISYITVCFNSAATIEACIRSVISQKNANIEYIIVDGGSRDGTLEILKKYENDIDYYVSENDSGIYNAMNKGVGLAKGQFLCFINSDDELLPGAAETVTACYRKTGVDMICGGRVLKQKGILQDEILYRRFPIKKCCFRYVQMFHQSTYARRELFERIGLFEEEYSLLADWIWESKAIDNDAKIQFIDEKLSIFNYDGASFKGIPVRNREWVKWIRRTFPFLSERDAGFFVNCLDRDRHPMLSFTTTDRVARRYKGHRDLMKTLYETYLFYLSDTLCDLESKYRSFGGDLEKQLEAFCRKKHLEKRNTAQIRERITSMLEASIYGTDPTVDLSEINILRSFQIEAMLDFLKLEHGGEKPVLKFRIILLLKRNYYLLSFLAGKSVVLSRLFYVTVRNRYVIGVARKVLPRKEWRTI